MALKGTMSTFKTQIFQINGVDVVAGDLIRVKPSGPYQRDGFIGRVMYANLSEDGDIAHITVYSESTRTFTLDRFEVMDSKAQEKQRLARQRAEEKRLAKPAKPIKKGKK